MKSDIKEVLEEAFAAPAPKQKEEFFREIGQPQISLFSFMLVQVSYIRKRVWMVSVLITILAVMSTDYVGQDSIWVISAMMPFIALCAITENARSKTCCMAELEMASKYSIKSITLARLSAIGLLHFIILCILIPFVGENALLPFVQVGIYLLVPYLLTSILGLMAVRKVYGKDVIYVCMGISLAISFLNLIIKELVPEIYEEKLFIWWCAFVIYLITRVWREYRKIIYQAEELVWN